MSVRTLLSTMRWMDRGRGLKDVSDIVSAAEEGDSRCEIPPIRVAFRGRRDNRKSKRPP